MSAALQNAATGSDGIEALAADRPLSAGKSREMLAETAAGDRRSPQMDALRARAARDAGRKNASATSDAEFHSLMQERQSLVQRSMDSGLSAAERTRLTYVRWQIDRIEDARYGFGLDLLEQQIRNYEELGYQIQCLREDIEKAISRR